jgi:hypothetical protein
VSPGPRPPADPSDELVLPAYGEGSLPDLVPSLLAALGAPGYSDVLGLPPRAAYCLLLVDGLGWRGLRAAAASAPFLASLPGRSLTAPVPSTTATSVTSVGTGLPPGRHGVVGYTSRIPGRTSLLNALDWDPSVDPGQYQPYPSLMARAAGDGVSATVVNPRRFARSGLTRVSLAGGRYLGADTPGERVAAVLAALDRAAGGPALVYAYESDLDGTGHRHGVSSDQWRHQLRTVDLLVEQLADELPPGCGLVVTGDHGMLDAGEDDQVDLEAIPGLLDGVELIGGEPRFRQVYTAPGAALEVAECWTRALKGAALVQTREQAVEAGWFGTVEGRVADRFGDVLVAGLGHTVMLVPSVWPREARMRGHHGSLTAAEMLVPCLVAE